MDLKTTLISYVNDGILAEKSPATLKEYHYSLNQLFEYIKCKFLPQDTYTLPQEQSVDLQTNFYIQESFLTKFLSFEVSL